MKRITEQLLEIEDISKNYKKVSLSNILKALLGMLISGTVVFIIGIIMNQRGIHEYAFFGFYFTLLIGLLIYKALQHIDIMNEYNVTYNPNIAQFKLTLQFILFVTLLYMVLLPFYGDIINQVFVTIIGVVFTVVLVTLIVICFRHEQDFVPMYIIETATTVTLFVMIFPVTSKLLPPLEMDMHLVVNSVIIIPLLILCYWLTTKLIKHMHELLGLILICLVIFTAYQSRDMFQSHDVNATLIVSNTTKLTDIDYVVELYETEEYFFVEGIFKEEKKIQKYDKEFHLLDEITPDHLISVVHYIDNKAFVFTQNQDENVWITENNTSYEYYNTIVHVWDEGTYEVYDEVLTGYYENSDPVFLYNDRLSIYGNYAENRYLTINEIHEELDLTPGLTGIENGYIYYEAEGRPYILTNNLYGNVYGGLLTSNGYVWIENKPNEKSEVIPLEDVTEEKLREHLGYDYYKSSYLHKDGIDYLLSNHFRGGYLDVMENGVKTFYKLQNPDDIEYEYRRRVHTTMNDIYMSKGDLVGVINYDNLQTKYIVYEGGLHGYDLFVNICAVVAFVFASRKSIVDIIK